MTDPVVQEAVIVRGLGGLYTLYRHEPPFNGLAWLRGILRQDERRPLVGDNVRFESSDDPDVPYVISEILPRRNASRRPAVANLDSLVIVASVGQPAPDFLLIDRLLVFARVHDIEPLLVLNKIDLAAKRGHAALHERFLANYAEAAVPLFELGLESTEVEHEQLFSRLKGKRVALAGQSGGGKSTRLNALFGESLAQTGEVSHKLGRGRHTTRETVLHPVDGGGFIADTPGFSLFTLHDLELTAGDLARATPEISRFSARCRFSDCRHDGDQGCAVEQATMHPERLQRYRQLLAETVTRQDC